MFVCYDSSLFNVVIKMFKLNLFWWNCSKWWTAELRWPWQV